MQLDALAQVFKDETWNQSSNYGLEHLGHLEADNQRLQQRLDSLGKQLAGIAEEAEVGPLWDRLEEVQRSLKTIATRQEQITQQLQAHNAIIGKGIIYLMQG